MSDTIPEKLPEEVHQLLNWGVWKLYKSKLRDQYVLDTGKSGKFFIVSEDGAYNEELENKPDLSEYELVIPTVDPVELQRLE